MGKKRRQQSDFWDTVHDIKRLTQPHLQQNKKHFIDKPGKKKVLTFLTLVKRLKSTITFFNGHEKESNPRYKARERT